MATFLSDTFTDTDATTLASHVGETGATWAAHATNGGGFRIHSNRVWTSFLTTGSEMALHYASGVPAGTEYDIDAVVRCVTTSGNVGIAWRVDTSARTFYLIQHSSSSNQWQLLKCVAGTFTSLDTAAATLTAGTDYAVHIETRDDGQTVTIDGGTTLTTADTSIASAGRVGLTGIPVVSSTTGKHVDSITATDFANTAPTVDAGADTTLTVGDTLTRTVSFVDPDADTWTATANYEGTGAVAATVDQGAKTVALSHTYSTAGAYTVTVVVNDGTTTGQDTFTLTVNNAPTSGYYTVIDVAGTDVGASIITLD